MTACSKHETSMMNMFRVTIRHFSALDLAPTQCQPHNAMLAVICSNSSRMSLCLWLLLLFRRPPKRNPPLVFRPGYSRSAKVLIKIQNDFQGIPTS